MTDGRDALLADESLVGLPLCTALSRWTDGWLAQLFDAASIERTPSGFALVAVGGYGRAELSPQSDLDVILLHEPRLDSGWVAEVAERIWYPIWDTGRKLGHAVRTVSEAVSLASDDLDTATALLDCRLIAGQKSLGEALASTAEERWRKRGRFWLGQLSRTVKERHERAGEVAFLLEPDLKEARGGLRDVHVLRWAQAAGATLSDVHNVELAEHYQTILGARVELHRRTGRPGDALLLEEQDAVAAALGDADADALMRRVATAARAIAWRSDESWRGTDAELARSFSLRGPRVEDLGHGIVLTGQLVDLTPDADLTDPVLPLRVGVVAARRGASIRHDALDSLAKVPAMPDPWPDVARELLVDLLSAGRGAIVAIEALDHEGIWEGIFPEWECVHSKPQRNAYHRFTVDRHLLETAANASALTDRVDRPDLLLVGALLHDIGKGRPGDHTDVGVEMVAEIGARMGFPPADVHDLVQMVRHHLLLPDIATRRDLSDDGTVAFVAQLVETGRVLHLLDALTEADSLATGPAAWGDWKAGLVRQLVARTAHVLDGGHLDEIRVDFPTDEHRRLMLDGERHILHGDQQITVIDIDRLGLFSRVSGVLALNGATVLGASAWSEDGHAVARFDVSVARGREVPWERITEHLDRCFDGRLALTARLAERIGTYRLPRPRKAHPIENRVIIDNEVSASATVVEVHCEDRMGLLFHVTKSLAELGLDIRSARVQTLGQEVVDAFYLVDPSGRKLVDPHALEAVEVAVLHALATAP